MAKSRASDASARRVPPSVLLTTILLSGAFIAQSQSVRELPPAAPALVVSVAEEHDPAPAHAAEAVASSGPLFDAPAADSTAATPSDGDSEPPVDKVARYLWGAYQRSPVKRDGHGDFTWKDGSAAERLGLPLQDYVIYGMDPDFREQLYHAGRAMDAAGISWTILSGFRDDYRQSIAAGFKAHGGYSLHGGSIATGGYGHGCAVDLTTSDAASKPVLWSWLDAHGAEFGLRRPLPRIDPSHVQPTGAWHARASELRQRRLQEGDILVHRATLQERAVAASLEAQAAALESMCVHAPLRNADAGKVTPGHSKWRWRLPDLVKPAPLVTNADVDRSSGHLSGLEKPEAQHRRLHKRGVAQVSKVKAAASQLRPAHGRSSGKRKLLSGNRPNRSNT